MTVVADVAAFLLGLIFLLAGASKLAAGRAWPVQARELGAPAIVIPVLPWVELAVGAALIAQVGEPWVAALAVLMLMGFTILIAMRIIEGRDPECACFGAWSSTPVGPKHIIRNAVLMVVGLLALYG